MLGGISQFTYDISKALPANLIHVISYPTHGWQEFDKLQKFSITRLSLSPRIAKYLDGKLRLLSPLYLGHLLRLKKPRIVICMHANWSLLFTAWLFSKIRGVPFGVILHGMDVCQPQTTYYRNSYNALLRGATHVFANGNVTKATALQAGVHPNRIHIIHPCIDPTLLKPEISADILRSRFGLDGKKCILSIGRLIKRKGFDTVIRALPLVLKRVPQAHYVLIGGGEYQNDLVKLVKDLKLEKHVTLVGPLAHNEAISFYPLCDVFAMVAREREGGDIESFGIVYLEANYFGKSVIAGRSGGVSDAVIDGVTGILVDPSSIDRLANEIIKLLINTALNQKMGEAGRERAIREFSSTAACQKFLDVINMHRDG